ncbi:VTT domain-containing protein [candidate division KSB1 bacterium]
MTSLKFFGPWRLRPVIYTTYLPLALALLVLSLAFHFLFPRDAGMLALFLYSIPGEFIIALIPHEPIILYYSKFATPLMVTLAALAGTLWMESLNYRLVQMFFHIPKLEQLKKSKGFQKTIKYFLKAPFLSTVVAAVTPVPFYPFRVVASAAGFPLKKYLGAIALGRSPRFYLLAYFGHAVPLPNKLIVFIFLALFLVLLVLWWRRRKEVF